MDIYFYDSYKNFLIEKINSLPKKGRGVKGQLAIALRCQTSYVSQVLNGSADFNPEQCFELVKFFNLSGDEREYFITLTQFNKAGSYELQQYYKEKLDQLREKRLTLHSRLKTQKHLNLTDSAQYFSSWAYAAVHVMLTIEAKRTAQSISDYLNIPIERVLEILNFLEEKGLAQSSNGTYKPGNTTLHLDKTSPFIRQHHTNWRNQAIKAIDRHLDKNLHYSSVVSISEKDAEIIHDEVIKFIAHIKTLISESSPEETMRGFCIDFFRLD